MVEVKCDFEKEVKETRYWRDEKCKCKCSTGKRLRYVQPSKQPSYAPVRLYRPPDIQMPSKTTYNLSYEAFDAKTVRSCKGTPSIAKENLVSAGSFCALTTHKMSYGAWPGMKTEDKVFPKDHRLLGEGPMSSLTTNKHDYTVKPISSVNKFIPSANLGFSTAPLENYSTMGLSYQCPDYNSFEAPVSYKPEMRYVPPSGSVDCTTVQKLSFQAWQAQPKEELPWAKKCSYEKPLIPLDATTIYNGSFIAPGKVIEDEENGHCKDCRCLYPGQCLEEGCTPDMLVCPKGAEDQPKSECCPPGMPPCPETTDVPTPAAVAPSPPKDDC